MPQSTIFIQHKACPDHRATSLKITRACHTPATSAPFQLAAIAHKVQLNTPVPYQSLFSLSDPTIAIHHCAESEPVPGDNGLFRRFVRRYRPQGGGSSAAPHVRASAEVASELSAYRHTLVPRLAVAVAVDTLGRDEDQLQFPCIMHGSVTVSRGRTLLAEVEQLHLLFSSHSQFQKHQKHK